MLRAGGIDKDPTLDQQHSIEWQTYIIFSRLVFNNPHNRNTIQNFDKAL